MRIEFAVYVNDLVPNWPAHFRQLRRCGVCGLDDLDAQEFENGEISVVVEQHGDPSLHAISLTPYAHLVARPEGT